MLAMISSMVAVVCVDRKVSSSLRAIVSSLAAVKFGLVAVD
jgi:hypothetical protein